MIPGFPDAAPIAGLTGGILIGLAAAIMLIGLGRIAGVSGIAARGAGLSNSGLPRAGAAMFLLGLPLGALVVSYATGGIQASFANPATLIGAGLLVGVGTRLGSGCTSGHGVCGVSRLSPRSLIATLTFITAGIATVAAMNAAGWAPLS